MGNNYGRIVVPTSENYHSSNNYSNNYNLHTLSDANNNYANNNSSKFYFNPKNGVGSRLNTVSHNESVEEFSRDLENPDRRDSLIMKYLKQKKLSS